jgi:predicted transcriptional regulator
MRKKQQRRIRITMRPYAEIMEDVIATCERIEKGMSVEPQDMELNFADAAHLLSTLSEKRMELLMFLHEHGPLNIRQLAKKLERDYSNVHTDVKLLLNLSLLATDKEKKVFVPWDELSIELPLGDLRQAV